MTPTTRPPPGPPPPAGASVRGWRGAGEPLVAAVEPLDGRPVGLRLDRPAGPHDLLVQGRHPRRRAAAAGPPPARGRDEAEPVAGHAVGQLDPAVGVEDDDGVGQAVDGHLRRLLGPGQPLAVEPAELAESRGHDAERLGQLPDLVPPRRRAGGRRARVHVQPPVGDLPGRPGQGRQGPQKPRDDDPGVGQGQHRPAGRHGQQGRAEAPIVARTWASTAAMFRKFRPRMSWTASHSRRPAGRTASRY